MRNERSIEAENAPVRMWLAEPLGPECKRAIERLSRLDDVRRIAVMPDVHAGSDVCTGVALATTRTLIPQAVGADIGCGMSTCRLEAPADAIADGDTAMRLFAALRRAVPVIRHNHRSPPALPAACDGARLSAEALSNALRRDGTIEFGTLGRGNHFLELQSDDGGALWLLVHSGSRAMGQVITRHHLAKTARLGCGVAALDAGAEAGAAYAADVRWGVTYARLSREAMLLAAADAIQRVLGIDPAPGPVWGTTHNSVTLERHGDEDLWVHRKGACAGARRRGQRHPRLDGRGVVPCRRTGRSRGALLEFARGGPCFQPDGGDPPNKHQRPEQTAERCVRRRGDPAAVAGRGARRIPRYTRGDAGTKRPCEDHATAAPGADV